MFLYEARARAPRTGTSAAQLGTHFFGMIGTRKGQEPKETHQEMTLDTISTHISGIGQALEPQKCLEIWAKKRSKAMEHAHYVGCGPGRGVPNLSRACPAGKGSLETRQKEKRGPQ